MDNLPGKNVSEVDREIFVLHNELRKNPRHLIQALEEMAKQFDGMLLKREGKVTLRTKEGIDAVNEAIEFCKKQTPMQPLRWVDAISKSS